MRATYFSRHTLAATPWKNGGGTTQEIACWPAGATLEDFGWRVSIATIAAPGPFSAFTGIDRSIMLLEGDGVRLRSVDGAIDHRLDTPHQPFAFPGEAEIDCALLGGASSDFNVMTRHTQWRAEVQVLEDAASIAPAPHGVLLALQGAWRLDGDGPLCRTGDGLWWTAAAQGWQTQVQPQTAGARLAVVRIVAAAQQPA